MRTTDDASTGQNGGRIAVARRIVSIGPRHGLAGAATVIVVALTALLTAAPALAHGRTATRAAHTGRGAPAQSCDTSWLGGSGDWDNPGNWSAGVPTPTTTACITAPGTYTVTSDGGEQNPGALTLGGSSGHQTLALNATCIYGESESLNLNGDSTINANGELDLYGCPTADVAVTQLQMGGGDTMTNSGTIVTEGTGEQPLIQGDLTNAGGTIDIQIDTTMGSGEFGSVLDNAGTINLGANVLSVDEGSAIDDTGGSISNNASTGSMDMNNSTYEQGAGTTSPDTPDPSNPAVIVSGSIQYTGSGASSIVLSDASSSLTGNIAADQNLTLQANCSGGDGEYAVANVPGDSSLTLAGTIILDHLGSCTDGQSALEIGGGSTVTITTGGLLQTQQTTTGPEPELTGNITTTGGTINIDTPTDYDGPGTLDIGGPLNLGANTLTAAGNGVAVIDDSGGSISNGGSTGSIQVSGSYAQGAGTTTPDTPNPTNPAVVVDGPISYTGTGASSIVFTDAAADLTGNIAAGQNLTLEGNCTSGDYAILYPQQSSFTSAGTITFTHVGGGTCSGGEDAIELPGGDTMTNSGKISAVGETTTNADTIDGILTNPGTVSVASGNPLVLSGTLTNYNSSTSTLSGGIYALSGTFQYDGSGFTASGIVNDGSTIVLRGGEFEDANGANALRNVATILTHAVLAYTTAASTSGSLSNAGTLVLAGSAKLSVNGNYTQTSTGTWSERPTTPTKYGVLDATGQSNLAGKLVIDASAGFTGGNGDVLTPLVSSSRTGTFSSVTGTGAGSTGDYFTVAYPTTGFTLTVHTATLALTPHSGTPGSGFTVTGSGWAHGERVTITFGTTTLTPATASSSGTIDQSETVPSVSAGSYTVTATGQTSGATDTATFTVT